MSPGGRRRLTGLLGLGCALALLLLAATLWQRPAPASLSASATAAARPPVFADPTSSLPRLEDMRATIERPLFLATRRLAPELPQAPAEGLMFGRYRFGGVVVAPGQRMLLLRPAEGGPIRRVREGEMIEGLRIERIARDRVVVSGRNGPQELPIGGKGKGQ
jgi:hypothetical protein